MYHIVVDAEDKPFCSQSTKWKKIHVIS